MRGRSKGWTYAGASKRDGAFQIEGVNVHNHKWVETGEIVNVRDPSYGMPYTFPVYQIEVEGRTIEFAAGEFSEGSWGYYTRVGGTRP